MHRIALIVGLSVSTAALAQGQGWSFLSGQTAGTGANLFAAQAGYPGVSFEFLHGMSERFDLGAGLNLNYGFEGSVNNVLPGIKPEAVVRVGLLSGSQFNLGLRFTPGPLFYFTPQGGEQFNNSFFGSGYTMAGFSIPVEMDLGIPVTSAILVNVSLSVPFFVIFGPSGGAVIPILAGGGAEYFISRQLSVSFETRMGPSIWAGNYAYFTFEALFGVAYHL